MCVNLSLCILPPSPLDQLDLLPRPLGCNGQRNGWQPCSALDETNRILCDYDPQALIEMVESYLSSIPEVMIYIFLHTLQTLMESGVMSSSGANSKVHGPTRRRTNQLLLNTITWTNTMKWSLGKRTGHPWDCPTCHDVNCWPKVTKVTELFSCRFLFTNLIFFSFI